MRTITVSTASSGEPTFATADAAMAHAESESRNLQAQRDTEQVKGAAIEAGYYTDHRVSLKLTNGCLLTFAVDGPIVVWSLTTDDIGQAADRTEPVLLRFGSPSNGSGESMVWDRGLLLRARFGSRVQMLFAGTAWLYLYTEGRPILRFASLRIEGEATSLLYWNETE